MERRREQRTTLDKYYSVEIVVKGQLPHYQIRIRDISHGGLSVLVSESSDFLTKIKVGDTVSIAFHTEKPPSYPLFREASVVYIEKERTSRYRNHCIVGLSVKTD